jgi:tRNA 2-thiocytidine biosynthesis protein TtcA
MKKDPFLPENPSNNFLKLRSKLISNTGKAIGDYSMIEDGDRVMVCLSGGKDSYTLLSLLTILQKRAPIKFEIVAVNLDQKQPGFPEDVLPNFLSKHQIEYKIIEEDTYSIVKEKIPEGKTTCSLCSRLRRGILYRVANELKASKIALGHHKNDIVETFFLNLFFGAKLKSMPPKLISDDKKNIVIRPLAYLDEKDISSYANHMNFPIIPCNLCGSQENLQRQNIKFMLDKWEKEYPGRLNKIFNALSNIEVSHLADRNLYNFKDFNFKEPKPIFSIIEEII